MPAYPFTSTTSPKELIGLRVEIPVHYDAWARGARFGRVTAFRHDKPGRSAYVIIKPDIGPQAFRVKVWRMDWAWMRKA